VTGTNPNPSLAASGADVVKRLVVDLRSGFPNIVTTIEDLSHEGDTIICRWKAKGTHIGTFWDMPATGRELEFTAVVFCRFAAERIINLLNYFDPKLFWTLLPVKKV